MNEIIWRKLTYQNCVYDRFEVSNNGKIRNSANKHIYKTVINKNGYEQVCVSLGGKDKKKIFRIHRAVAETFIPNPNNKRAVNHIDGNKSNNYVDNLEWVTDSENMFHAFNTGLAKTSKGIENANSKLSKEDIMYIKTMYMPRNKQYGSRALGRKFGVDHMRILDVVKGRTYIDN